jgi:hypothetical protein
MFLLGSLIGAAAAAWFILADEGRRLVRFADRVSRGARLLRDWWDHPERFDA